MQAGILLNPWGYDLPDNSRRFAWRPMSYGTEVRSWRNGEGFAARGLSLRGYHGLRNFIDEGRPKMYTEFFGLRCLPFADRADTQFFHATPELEEALASMVYEVQFGKGMGLIIGEAGLGKTLLVRSLLARLASADHTVVLTCPTSGGISLLREACKGFGVSLSSSGHPSRGLSRLRRHLSRMAKTDQKAVLVVDQAENLSTENIAQLGTLADIQNDESRLLSILIVGQPKIKSLIAHPDSSRLRQQLFGERVLQPFSLEQTRAYIAHRLTVAGVGDAEVFTHDATAFIHDAAHGNPRLINTICNKAMLAAYGAERSVIDRTLVKDAIGHDGGGFVSAPAGDLISPTTPSRPGVSDVTSTRTHLTTGRSTSVQHVVRTKSTSSAFDTSMPQASEPQLVGSAIGFTTDGDDGLEVSRRRASRRSLSGVSSSEVAMSQRLERTIARAERMQATMEASFSQYTAIEKHLAVLAQSAEHITVRLTQVSDEATDSVGEMQERVASLTMDTQHQVQEIERRVARATDQAGDAVRQVERVEHVCERADRVEERLESFAEQLADKADAVGDRMAELTACIEASDSAQIQLVDGIEKVSKQVDVVKSLEEDVVRPVENKLTELKDQANKCAKAAADEMRSAEMALQEQVGNCKAKQDVLFAQAREQIDVLNKDVADVTARQARMSASQETVTGRIEQNASRIVELDMVVGSTESRLGVIDEKADALGERMAKLTASIEVSDTAHIQLVDGIEKVRKQVEDVQSLEQEVVRPVENKLTELKDQANKCAKTAADAMHSAAQSLQEQVGNCKAKLEQEVVRPVENKLIELKDQANKCAKTAADAIRSAAQSLQEQVGNCKAKQDVLFSQAREKIDVLNKDVADVTVRHGRMSASQEVITGRIEANARRIAELDTAMVATESSLCAHADKSRSIHDHAAEVVGRGERLLSNVQECCGRIDSIQRESSGTLEQIGRAAERAMTARTQLEESASKFDQRSVMAAQEITRLEASATQAERTREQIESCLQRVDSAIAKVNEQVGPAKQILSATEQKIAQLDSHNAAATNVLRSLTEANVQARGLIDESGSATAEMEKKSTTASAAIDRAIQEVWSLTSTVTTRTKELAKENVTAGDLLTTLQATIAPAEKLAARIGESVAQAKAYSDKICDELGDPKLMIERVESVTRLMKAAKEAEESVGRTIKTARETIVQMDEATTLSARNRDMLSTVNEQAQQIMARHDELGNTSAEAFERISEQLDAERSAGEAREHMVREFAMQAQTLGEQLYDLRRRAEEIQGTIDTTLAKPEQVVASARSHANHLEQVCGAVKKIFSKLSKVALDANDKSTEFQRISDEKSVQFQRISNQASERLVKLNAETEQASLTLNEWVREAIRAQERLAQTIERAPSLSVTHPPTGLERLSTETSKPKTADKSSLLARPGKSSTVVQDSSMSSSTSGEPHSRDEEIARIIADAKRASANVPK